MLLSSRAFTLSSLGIHSSLMSKVAIGIVTGTAVIVAVGMVYSLPEALSPVDASSVMATASPMPSSPSKLRFTDTDPLGNAERLTKQGTPGMLPQESKDVEANTVNGHIQAF